MIRRDENDKNFHPCQLWLGVGALLLTLPPTRATAQAIEDARVPGSEPTTLSEIVIQASKATEGYRPATSYVATGMPTDVIDTPRSVNVASQELLSDRGVTNLEEALETIPGVSRDNSFGGTQDSFNIRGFRVYSSTASVDPGILVDGISGAMARGFQANTDRVEVLSGPSSMLYGRTEPGGLINIVRKQPLYEPYYALEADGGSYDHARVVGDASGPIASIGDGTLAYRLIASGEHQDYWRNVGHDMHDVLVAPSIGWRSDRVQAVLAYEYDTSVAPLDRGTILGNDGRPLPVPASRSFSENFSKYDSDSHFVRGSLDFKATDNLTLRSRVAFMHYVSSDLQVNTYELNDDNTIDRYIMGNQHDAQDTWFAQQSALLTFNTGSLAHTLLFGGDYRGQHRDQEGQVISGLLTGFNYMDPVYGQITPDDASPEPNTGPFFLNNNKEWGMFAQDSVTIGNLTAVAGLRWADIKTFALDEGEVLDSSHTHAFLPSGSLLYKLTDDSSVYGSVSTSYHPNQATPATPFAPASGPFQPERGTGWEVGAKQQLLDRKVLATVALFHIDKKNVLVTDNNITESAGGVRSQGLELSAAGNLTPELNVTAAYSYIDAKFEDDPNYAGNRFVNVPKHKGSVFGTYQVATGPLTGLAIGGGVTASSDIAVNSANTMFLPGYATVEAMIRYRAKLANGLIYRVQLNGSNLLDRAYYPYSNGSLRVGVGEPREALLTLKVEF